MSSSFYNFLSIARKFFSSILEFFFLFVNGTKQTFLPFHRNLYILSLYVLHRHRIIKIYLIIYGTHLYLPHYTFKTIFLLLPLLIITLHTLSLILPRVLKILLHWLSSSNFNTNKTFCTIDLASLPCLIPTPKLLHYTHSQHHSPQPYRLQPLPN